MKKLFLIVCVVFLAACSPSTPISTTPALVEVYATSAAGAWLNEASTCAAQTGVTISVVSSSSEAELVLRIGEPGALTTPVYQIDTEEILVAAHRESPLQSLTLERVRDLFAGRGDPSVQVWVYASGEDSQKVFDQLVMAGGGVTSFARMAASPQEMSDALNKESNAVGILPKHWLAGSLRTLYSMGTVPVLALTQEEPQGALKNLIACLQR